MPKKITQQPAVKRKAAALVAQKKLSSVNIKSRTELLDSALESEPSIHRFMQWISVERRLAANTQSAYARDLAQLTVWANKSNKTSKDVPHSSSHLTSMSVTKIRQALAHFHAQGLAPKSLSRMLSSWRVYFQYLVDREAALANPCLGMSPPKTEKRLPNILTGEQAGALMNALRPELTNDDSNGNESQQNDWQVARDRAVFELAYSSGLRVSELTSLDLPAINLAAAEVRVLGKGNKTRVVPVGEYAIQALQAWLIQRERLKVANTEAALFIAAKGGRLQPRTVQMSIKKYAALAHLEMDIHPHMLRHSCASHVLQNSQDLRAVQELLGHASIASTQVYTHLDFTHLTKVYDMAHPRAKRPKPEKNET